MEASKISKSSDNQWADILKSLCWVESKKNYWIPSEGYAKSEEKTNMNCVIAEAGEEKNEYKRFLLSVLVYFLNCENIYLKGVIFQNSPAWNLYL